MDENPSEIWSEYFRIKHTLMDYDENLRQAIASARMLMMMGGGSGRSRVHLAKAQKHVALIMDLATSCGAFPPTAYDGEEGGRLVKIAQGNWKGVEDFEYAQTQFRRWYMETRFYNVAMKVDSRPGVVRKY